MDDLFLQVVNDEKRITSLLSQLQSPCSFYVCLGSTLTSDLAGISAAGSTPEFRRLTPAADAEALLLGKTVSLANLPVSPLGVVSPVVITRACLQAANVTPQVVNCGAFVAPQIPHLTAGTTVAECVTTGRSMPLSMVISLFGKGFDLGLQESVNQYPLIISECVPGGTTTALAVLLALGYDAQNSLSGSIPDCNHAMRLELVQQGLQQAGIKLPNQNPFEIMAAVGDPMQPFVLGMTLAACQNRAVILAGGSQMLAVYALCAALASEYDIDMRKAQIGVVTTKWVAFDKHARIADLSKQVAAPLAATAPQFNLSIHSGLRLYEEGNVKEGVGAGAAMALGYRALGRDSDLLMRKIDQSYDDMVAKLVLSEPVS